MGPLVAGLGFVYKAYLWVFFFTAFYRGNFTDWGPEGVGILMQVRKDVDRYIEIRTSIGESLKSEEIVLRTVLC